MRRTAGTRRSGQARHRAARADDLFVGQQHLHRRAAAGRALPAGLRPARPVDPRRQPPLDHCGGSQGGDLVKRVIALPGQTIYSSGNSIYIDGRRLAETYLPPSDPLGPPIPDASRQHPYRVPPGEFYVLGDNRADSCDSRYWGPIQGSSIIGKVVLTFWHDSHPDLHRF